MPALANGLGLSRTRFRSGIPALPAGSTARWNVRASTGSDGDLIASVSDLIGSNTATAAGSARPTLKTGANGLNGRPVMRFNGVNNRLILNSAINGAGPWTVACVLKTSAMPIIGSNINFFAGIYRGGANRIEAGDKNNFQYSPTTPAPGNVWELLTISHSGAAGGCSGSLNGNALVFGANNSWPAPQNFNVIGLLSTVYASGGDIADLIMYQRVFNASDVTQINSNLNAAWGGIY